MAKKRRHKGSNRREMICISLVVLVLLGVVAVQSSRLRDKNAAYEAKVELLNEQIQEESERALEIAELEAYVNTKEYAAQAAKEKLGMVGEDEILFKAEN